MAVSAPEDPTARGRPERLRVPTVPASSPVGVRARYRLTRALTLFLVTVACAGSARPLAAQQVAEPVLEGRVVKGGGPIDTATVVLHRVGVDTAGQIDSVRTAADGAFRLLLPSVPDPGGRGEVYFASVRHQGILYFGPALHRAVQLDSLYTVEVYDTTVVAEGGAAPLTVDVRYVVMEPSGEGWAVTDLFQVQNGGERTLVPGEEGRTVWSHPLPEGIRDVEIGAGDLPPDATVWDGEIFRVLAPVPPGQRQFVVRYLADDLEMGFPTPEPVAQMELLVREPAPPLAVTGLTAAAPVEMAEGRSYRRYTGTAVGAGPVTLELAPEPRTVPAPALAVGLTLLLTLAGLWVYIRSRAATPDPATPGGPGAPGAPGADGTSGRPSLDPRQKVIIEVARIDEALGRDEVDEAEADRLRGRRLSLIRRLEALDP